MAQTILSEATDALRMLIGAHVKVSAVMVFLPFDHGKYLLLQLATGIHYGAHSQNVSAYRQVTSFYICLLYFDLKNSFFVL